MTLSNSYSFIPFKTENSTVCAHALPIEYRNISTLGVLDFISRRLQPILYVQPLNRTGNFFNAGIYKSYEGKFLH